LQLWKVSFATPTLRSQFCEATARVIEGHARARPAAAHQSPRLIAKMIGSAPPDRKVSRLFWKRTGVFLRLQRSATRRSVMKSWRKIVLYSGTVLPVIFACSMGCAQTYLQNASPSSQNWANSPQNWRNNPDNWQNSPQNYQNSAQDWKNSPQNWQNSANNYNSSNGIYDSAGNRVGYSVPTANGGMNYFNNDGSRRGYQPGH
jgi:hypothetical protein